MSFDEPAASNVPCAVPPPVCAGAIVAPVTVNESLPVVRPCGGGVTESSFTLPAVARHAFVSEPHDTLYVR